MKNNHFSKILLALVVLLLVAIPLRFARAAEAVSLPSFSSFVAAVTDGQAKMVKGVYVPETLALRVMQQPGNDPESVLEMDGVATQFGLATRNHVIGLLAHNDLAGAAFSSLKVNQEVRIVYGDGRVEYYQINRLAWFQVLQSDGQSESYKDLRSNVTYSSQAIFNMFYDGAVHVTFQTCIRKGDSASWGRLFVTATPVISKNILQFQEFGLQGLRDFSSAGEMPGVMNWGLVFNK